MKLPHGDLTALRRRCEELGEQLRVAMDGVLTEMAKRGYHDQRSIQAAFDLSQSTTSRLLAAVRTGDALATLSLIPGPDALQQVGKGALKAGVAGDCLAVLDVAIGDLRALLTGEISGRGTLDAVLSDWVQESRGSFELRHKAAAYRAMSAIRGVQAELALTLGIIHPSADPALHDCVVVDAVLDSRRVRPSGILRRLSSQRPSGSTKLTLQNLQGQPVESMQDLILHGYSNIPAESMESTRYGDVIETAVHGLPLGGSRPRGGDLVVAQVLRGMHRARRSGGSPTTGLAGQVEPPVEHFVLDVLLHDDVWPNIQPELMIFDTVVRGNAHPDDPSRRNDRIDLLESVQQLGLGAAALRLAEFARYPELIAEVCASMDWDPARLRAYRTRVRYPIYGSQIGLAFALPE